jgi:hypothetical protein
MPGTANGGWLRVTLLASLAMLGGSTARAAGVETLLMPGKVTQAHAKIETECSKCHDRSDRSAQSRLCLDCHKEIAADVSGRRGYHGRMANAGAGQCRACHSEHGGRSSDIVQLDPAQFDHALADFALEGAHRTLACASCHKDGEAWSKAPAACGACHKGDDVHRGQLGQNCADCHGSSSWSGARFDHGKTKFALSGAHTSVACNACHVGGHYKETPQSCVGCHATDDAHRGSRGDKCGNCHTTSDWKTARFDHGRETGFALLGRHDQLDCSTCHRSGNFKDKLPKDCHGCHQADDAHAARFGGKCQDCHGNEHWQPVDYDHLVKAKFELVGAHAKLGCHVCHTAPVETQKLKTDCRACHRAQDPHGGSLEQGCDDCHGQQDWHGDIVFDHELTDFPLVGLHAVVSCAQCHRTQAFARAPTTCFECHGHDDVHKGGLGKKCESCHSPNGWSIWEFDHAKQTGFALSGAHAKLQCAGCHQEPPGTRKMRRDCISCHRKDDRHLGAYGLQCDRCHTTWTFKGARVQ